MTVPVDKIFLMLSYAAGFTSVDSLMPVGKLEQVGQYEFLGAVLADASERSLRAGLPQEYSVRPIQGRSLRGRIDFARQIRSDQRGATVLNCVADELGGGTVSTRLIKTAALSLLRSALVSAPLAIRLRGLASRLQCDPLSSVPPRGFRSLQLSLMPTDHAVACFAAWLVVTEQQMTSGHDAGVFAWPRTAQQMGLLFQEFVRQFLIRRCGAEANVRSERYSLALGRHATTVRMILPELRSDVVLLNASDVLVIETKLMAPLAESGWSEEGVPKLRSSHLAQLFTYLHQARDRYPRRTVRGMLMYASEGASIVARFVMGSHEIAVLSIDWRSSHAAVLETVGGAAAWLSNEAALSVSTGEASFAPHARLSVYKMDCSKSALQQ